MNNQDKKFEMEGKLWIILTILYVTLIGSSSATAGRNINKVVIK